MFEFICILNLFMNIFLLAKLTKENKVVIANNIITSDIDKKVNNTSGIFNRLYGRF